MNTQVLPAGEPQTIHRAQRFLSSGRMVAFPTDTVYGVGAHAFSPEAVAALFAAKNRPTTKAIPILVARIEDMARVAHPVPTIAWRLAERFWPGGLTLVLPCVEEIPSIVTAGGDTVALRCPDHAVPLALINALGAPLAATSANLSGQASPTSADQVVEQLKGRVPLVIDGGQCPVRVSSTVIDLSVSPPRLLRAGAIPTEKLNDLLPDLTS